VVDDDPGLLRLLSIRLSSAGYSVDTATEGKEALTRITANRPDLVITDLRMPGMDGMELFDQIHERHALMPVIVLTAHGTIPDAVKATQRGVSAYLTKPFDSSELLACVERVLSAAGGNGRSPVTDDGDWRKEIVSRSAAMDELLQQVRRVAASDTSVLLRGASGTGKELLARAIHAASPRHDHEFVAVNCAAIPETLLESELFGHAKGAFTGASQVYKGLFCAAEGGTLFLDEIGDMPLSTQAKVLRAIEERAIRPVGSTRTVPVDVRIISATHQDLDRVVESREFREDLFYRLNVVSLEIPPLARRREDIPLLCNHFLKGFRKSGGSAAKSFSPEAMEALLAAPWPGNIRQLRNVVEQCSVMASSTIIDEGLVRRALKAKTVDLLPLADARDRFEHDYLTRLLQLTDGNVSQAARLAQRNRSEFYKLLNKHGLEPELFRRADE
jgi:two-component system response regulator GlrR